MSDLLDFEVPKSPCPYCHRSLDRATFGDEERPSPGDITMCIACTRVCVFGTNMILRKPTHGERVALKNNAAMTADIEQKRVAIRVVWRKRAAKWN